MTLLSIMLLIGGARLLFQKKFSALGNLTSFLDVQENTIPFSFFINFILSILVALILCPFTKPFFNIGIWTNFSHLIIITLIVVIYMVIRFLIDGFISIILDLSNDYKSITNTKIFFRVFTIILLLLLNFALYYSSFSKNIILYIALGVIVLTIILEYIYQLRKSGNSALYGSYYFILYLCVLEILPALYVLKHIGSF